MATMVFNLVFANNSILSWLFQLFLIIDLDFLIPVVISQILSQNEAHAIYIPNNEGKAGIDTYPVKVETKIRILFKLINEIEASFWLLHH